MRNAVNRIITSACALAVVITLFAVTAGPVTVAGAAVPPSQMRFVNIVKLTGVNWFNRMETGLKDFGSKTGVHVEQTGPAQASAEGQVSIIQSLIPQKPTVIGVVPNNQQSLEGVLQRARAAHIIVVAQEASQIQNADIDIEAFANTDYGASMMDALATCMGGKGQYAAFVGHLTAQSHMEWVAGALAEAQKKYPGITRVTGPLEENEDANITYQKTKALLAKYPNIRGFEGSAAEDVLGIARAATELGLAGKVCIVGTSLPSIARQYVENGTVYEIFCWDPAAAGEATMYAGLMLAEGKSVGAGTNLGVPGYTSIQPCGGNASSHCFRGTAQLGITKATLDKYPF